VNAELNYLIPVGDDHFTIDLKSGEITTNTVLDREQQDSWVITGRHSPRLMLGTILSLHLCLPHSLHSSFHLPPFTCHSPHLSSSFITFSWRWCRLRCQLLPSIRAVISSVHQLIKPTKKCHVKFMNQVDILPGF